MNRIITALFIACFALFGLACGGPEGELMEDTQDNLSITAGGGGDQSAVGQACAQSLEGGRGELCAASNGYCCNTSTLNVSKTKSSGCDAPDTWHTTIVNCINNSVCGQSCRIN